MPPLDRDTSPEADDVQIELLRRATPAERVRLARSLSRTVISLSLRALRRADPAASDDDIAVRFVALHHGGDLARRFGACLAERRRKGLPRVCLDGTGAAAPDGEAATA